MLCWDLQYPPKASDIRVTEHRKVIRSRGAMLINGMIPSRREGGERELNRPSRFTDKPEGDLTVPAEHRKCLSRAKRLFQ